MIKFAGIEEQYSTFERSKIVLQSVPFDGTSTWGKGAHLGFEAFLDAAENMELFDIETNSEVYHHGIFVPNPLGPFEHAEEMYHATYEQTKQMLKWNKFLTFFGGEHSISIGVMKAFYEHYDNLSFLQIDAHADLRPSYDGTRYNHACALHDVSQNANLIQVGIRSMDESELRFMKKENVFFAHEIHSSKDWISDSIEKLTDQVYITLDLDALDPSIMPATGTPEPGGLTWQDITTYLRAVFQNKNVVGFDIVELAPIDSIHHPQFLVAKLYYKMLSYKFCI